VSIDASLNHEPPLRSCQGARRSINYLLNHGELGLTGGIADVSLICFRNRHCITYMHFVPDDGHVRERTPSALGRTNLEPQSAMDDRAGRETSSSAIREQGHRSFISSFVAIQDTKHDHRRCHRTTNNTMDTLPL
jgi:hypothetical protein